MKCEIHMETEEATFRDYYKKTLLSVKLFYYQARVRDYSRFWPSAGDKDRQLKGLWKILVFSRLIDNSYIHAKLVCQEYL